MVVGVGRVRDGIGECVRAYQRHCVGKVARPRQSLAELAGKLLVGPQGVRLLYGGIAGSASQLAGQALAAENIVRQAVIAFPRRNARLSSPGARRHVTHLIEHLRHRRLGGGIRDLVTDGYFAVHGANVDQVPPPRARNCRTAASAIDPPVRLASTTRAWSSMRMSQNSPSAPMPARPVGTADVAHRDSREHFERCLTEVAPPTISLCLGRLARGPRVELTYGVSRQT